MWSYMGSGYRCHPSVATLSQGTGLGERTVQRHLVELAEAGLIDRIEQKGRVTEYQLYPPWDPSQDVTTVTETPLSECHPCQNVTPDSVSGDPRQNDTTTPVTVTPEVTQEKKPNEVTQLTLLPAVEANDSPKQGGTAKGSKKGGDGYSPEFEEFWAAYPRRKEKGKAWRVWLARVNGKSGQPAKPVDMITAAKNYAAECSAEGREEKWVKLASTFLGPDKHWEEFVQGPKAQSPSGGRNTYRDHTSYRPTTNDPWE